MAIRVRGIVSMVHRFRQILLGNFAHYVLLLLSVIRIKQICNEIVNSRHMSMYLKINPTY